LHDIGRAWEMADRLKRGFMGPNGIKHEAQLTMVGLERSR
jgi:hypothetical protein